MTLPIRLTWSELAYYWTKAIRNGRIHRLVDLEAPFYKSCMLLAKIKGVLINPKVVSMLLDIIKKLTQTPKYEALRRGWKRIREMLSTFRRNGVLNWAPRVREWMSDERFIIYLGFMEMNNPIYYRSTL